MLANYNIISKGGKITKLRDKACFSTIHPRISDYDKVRIFILDDYEEHNSCDDYYLGCNSFSFKEKKEYCSLLRKMGLHVSDPKRSSISDLDYGPRWQKCTYIDVYTGDMVETASLLSIYAVRYLYEDNFQTIAENFLKWKDENQVPLIDRFLLAHYTDKWKTYNHTFVCYNKIILLPSQEEYFDLIHSSERTSSLSMMFNFNYCGSIIYQRFIDSLNNSLQQGIDFYNQLRLEEKKEDIFDDGF